MSTLTNGLSQGDFTLLNVLHNGAMTDILTLVGGGGRGGGIVTSVSAPLNINSGVLSLNLSGICTAATNPLTLNEWPDDYRFDELQQHNADEHCDEHSTAQLRHLHSSHKFTGCIYEYIEFDYSASKQNIHQPQG